MTRTCAISKILSSAFLFFAFFPQLALGQFRDHLDRRVADDIVKSFASSCPLKVAAEADAMNSIKLELESARRLKIPEVMNCFDTYFSQIQGIVFAFEKTCGEVTSSANAGFSENKIARSLIGINRYKDGMRPFHSALNDCLLSVPGKKGRRFVVPLTSAAFNIKQLKKLLDSLKQKDPHVFTSHPHR